METNEIILAFMVILFVIVITGLISTFSLVCLIKAIKESKQKSNNKKSE